LQEGKQVGVYLVCQSGAHAVWGTGIDLQRRVLNQFHALQGRGDDGNNLVGFTMQDQRGHIDLLQVFGEVGFRKSLNAVVRMPWYQKFSRTPSEILASGRL
jgi:hypothetical protein